MAQDPLTLHALISRSIARCGDALAVRDVRCSWSYRELDARAAALAGHLRRRGVARGDIVAIYAERSAQVVAAVVAVLRAGASFLPVSLDTPRARLASVLGDAAPKALLVDRAGDDVVAGRSIHRDVWLIDDLLVDAPANADSLVDVDVTPDDLAYVIYTSGTAGQPKGVLIEHGSIARRFHDWDRVFGLSDAPPRCLQTAKLGFDVFTGDVSKALGSGGSLVICPTDDVIAPARLHRWLVDERIDYFDTVPAVLRSLVEHLETSGQNLASVRIINCGADVWTSDDYRRARRVTRGARLFNGYGVTECTVETALFEDDGTTLDHKRTLPIGHALASDHLIVVDDALEPVAPDVVGQVCIGGPCVARGYLNRPELNERVFFSRADDRGEPVRYYQTGDLGRVGVDGVFEVLGRIDSQLKINGHRIEPAEIEQVLEQVPGVLQAVAFVDPTSGRLSACVRMTEGTRMAPAECATFLRRFLPAYMIPSRIIPVERMPLSQNGKVDRARLGETVTAGTAGPASGLDDLHMCRNVNELRQRLDRADIDLVSIASEFVKPSRPFGLAVIGAWPEGTATAASSLDLLIVLDEIGALKRKKRDVAGHVVEYPSDSDGVNTRASLTIDGLRICVVWVIIDGSGAPLTTDHGRWTDAAWIVCGDEVVERWLRSPRSSPLPSQAPLPPQGM